jgi:hypothetical protein
MSENISQIENLTNQLDDIQFHYNSHLNEPDNDGHVINLIIAIFDYMQYYIISEKGFEIIKMNWASNNDLYLTTEDELIKGQCIFRASLFLTVSYQLFAFFIGMLQTAENISEDILNQCFQPDDPQKKIIDKIKMLYEIKKYTNMDFPNLHKKICELIIVNDQHLSSILNTFNFESAILYNQEKRRLFKEAIFGELRMDIPDEDIETLRKKAMPIND